MNSYVYNICVLVVASAILTASAAPVEVNREKRGVILSAMGGAALGALAGAIIPGVSMKTGALAGAALGGGSSLLSSKKKDTNQNGSRQSSSSDNRNNNGDDGSFDQTTKKPSWFSKLG